MTDLVSMVDDAKLHRPIYSTFEMIIVCHVVRCYHGELGLFS